MSLEELPCFPSLVEGVQPASFAPVNILLSIITFPGNFLILVALQKESALHAPSKLLYRCLTTTDLLVGLVAQPLYVTYRMSMVTNTGLFIITQRDQPTSWLSIMWNFFVNDGGNNRRQTSRPVVGADIQRECNFEECLYNFS